MLGQDEINHRFGRHATTGDYGSRVIAPRQVLIRLKFKELATQLDSALDDGREKAEALTLLESASMWAQKSLSRSGAGTRLVEDEPEKEIDTSEDRDYPGAVIERAPRL